MAIQEVDPLISKMIDDIVRAHHAKFPAWRPLFLEPRFGKEYDRNLDRTRFKPAEWRETGEVVGFMVLQDTGRSSGDMEEVLYVPLEMVNGISAGHAAMWIQMTVQFGQARHRNGLSEGRRAVHDRLTRFLSLEANPEDDLEEDDD